MNIWEKLFLGILALGVIFWMLPGMRQRIEESRDAPKDWSSVLIPLVAVVVFIILLISSVR